MNIILCGLPMSGKSTIGQLLAKELGWDFVDTDKLIEKSAYEKSHKQRTCRQIHQEEGDSQFREIERQQILSLKGYTNHVIAVGGGSMMIPENIKALQKAGELIYLRASPNYIWERMKAHPMPSYLDPISHKNSFFDLAEKRLPHYEKAAHAIIDIDYLTKQEIVNRILKHRNSKHGQ